MPLLSTLASQQADLLFSDSLQFEEAVRRSLLKRGEVQTSSQETTESKQESRDVYEIPKLEMLTDRLTALQQTRDALVAQKINLQELINDYNHHVAMQAHRAEQNDQISDERKEHLESTLTWNSYNADNERRLHGLRELDGEIEEVEKQIEAQESAIKEYKVVSGESEEEDTSMGEGVECLVCFEDVANTITPALCQHTICNTCAHTYIFTTKQMKLPASCPADVNCPGQIHFEQLQNRLSPEDLDKLYGRALERELIDSGEAFYCSNSRCAELLQVADTQDLHVECPSCATRMCSSCKVPWHGNFTCEAYQNLPEAERGEADLVLLNLARKEAWKRCPKCKTMISLTTGCNHMTCRCAYEFCYVCSAEWRKETGCPTGCALWDENNLVQEPIADPPIAFVQAARANIPGRLRNPPRGINLVDLDLARTQGPLRRSLLQLECMYCDRQFRHLSDLSKHYNFTNQHEVWACCGKVFLNGERHGQHTRVTHG